MDLLPSLALESCDCKRFGLDKTVGALMPKPSLKISITKIGDSAV